MNKGNVRESGAEQNIMTFRSDFMRFNIGHVVTMLVTAASLVWQASQFRERVSLLEQRHINDNGVQTTAVNNIRTEFRTSLAAQSSAMNEIRAEFRSAIDSALRNMKDVGDSSRDFVALQEKLVDGRLNTLEQGARDNRELISHMATLEANVQNIRDVVGELRRNQSNTVSVAR